MRNSDDSCCPINMRCGDRCIWSGSEWLQFPWQWHTGPLLLPEVRKYSRTTLPGEADVLLVRAIAQELITFANPVLATEFRKMLQFQIHMYIGMLCVAADPAVRVVLQHQDHK